MKEITGKDLHAQIDALKTEVDHFKKAINMIRTAFSVGSPARELLEDALDERKDKLEDLYKKTYTEIRTK